MNSLLIHLLISVIATVNALVPPFVKMMKRNFYDILNVAPSATLEELKSNYKHLILQCHPDKLLQQQQQKQQHQLHGSNADKLENDLNNEEFVAITEAWNCLKDPSKRKQYDAELLLNKFHTHNNIYAHIQLSEMKKCLSTDVVELADDSDEGAADADEGIKSDSNKESSLSPSSLPSYFYTYDCRCGGQYIVDESAEQYCRKVNSTADAAVVGGDGDDADITQNNNSPNKTAGYNNDDGGAVNGGRRRVGGADGSVGSSEGGGGVAFHEDNAEDDSDGELIVECSECSLVIILNG